MKDLAALFLEVKEKKLAAMTRRAQKWALSDWRDNTIGPGVGDRFTAAGATFYGFSGRRYKYRQAKGNAPSYVKSGAFRDSLLKRNPRSSTNGSEVSTRISIFGGVLNLLGNMHGVKSETVSQERHEVHRHAYVRRAPRGIQKTVQVRAYDQMHTFKVTKRVLSPRTYKEEFAVTAADLVWIGKRTDQRFSEVFRATALTKSGSLRRSVRAFFRADDQGVSA